MLFLIRAKVHQQLVTASLVNGDIVNIVIYDKLITLLHRNITGMRNCGTKI